MRIEWENLVVERGSREVLRGVSLAAEPGEVLTIVGPNGAGKSTLVLAGLGMLPVKTGHVRLDGHDPRRLNRREVGRRAAYVPQLYEGYVGFTVLDVVASGRYVHLPAFGAPGPEDREAVARALADSGLLGMEHRPVNTLSGGERQKVWLAAAMAQGSPGLLLDEPTSALDPHHQADLIRLIRRQAAEGKTVVVICHDLNLPAMLGAKVAALKDGQVVFWGSTAEFMQPALLERIFDTRFVVARQDGTDKTWIGLTV
jgi:ABC-type cobalamin/Fe3+-siderophores transport system ATPase subunit